MWCNVKTLEVAPFRCKSGRCERSDCRDMYCKKRLALLCNLIPEYNLQTFFTLTLDRSLTLQAAWDTIAHIWLKMRKRLNRIAKRSEQAFRYVAVLEAHKDGYPHIHGFTNLYVWKTEWSYHWEQSGGGRNGSNVKGVTDTLKAGEYVGKELEVGKYVGKDNLCRALKQVAPRKRTMWRSKGLKTARELAPKVQSDWRLVVGVKVNGKVYERKDLEAAQRALSEGSIRQSVRKLEAETEERIGCQEGQRVAGQAISAKRRNQAHEELVRECGLAKLPAQSELFKQMIRENVWQREVERYQAITRKVVECSQ